jgi:hypothetical protein
VNNDNIRVKNAFGSGRTLPQGIAVRSGDRLNISRAILNSIRNSNNNNNNNNNIIRSISSEDDNSKSSNLLSSSESESDISK